MISRIVLVTSLLLAAGMSDFAIAKGGAAAKRSTASYDRMPLTQARHYMVMLINYARQRAGLQPVALDPLATIAAQKHADYLLSIGANGHYELNGSKPVDRYNAVGGTDYVAENWGCTAASAYARKPDPTATFSREDIYGLMAMWMDSPLHRDNIVDKNRTHVGIGLSQAKEKNGIHGVQEFINKYGTISRIPLRITRGQSFPISGSLYGGYKFQAVVVMREDFPKRMTEEEMNNTHSYTNGTESVTNVFPSASSGGSNFCANVVSDKSWKPGMYYFFVWAINTRTNEKVPVSILTCGVF